MLGRRLNLRPPAETQASTDAGRRRLEINANVSGQRQFDRRFYLGCGIAFFSLVFWAFARTYFLKNFFETPALTRLVHIHGLVMTGWVLLLVVQAGLVVARRITWHRRLGVLGAAWAVLVVVLGSVTTFQAAAREVRERSEIAAFQVSILGLELLQMLLFATLVVAAISLRRRTDYHKRFMLLTSACMLPSAISRLPLAITALSPFSCISHYSCCWLSALIRIVTDGCIRHSVGARL